MSGGGIELHEPAGLAIAFVVTLSLIATFLLIGAALRQARRSWMARLAAISFAAACVCNWSGHMWSTLRPALWACIPLQALAIVTALIALLRARRERVRPALRAPATQCLVS